MLALWSGRYLGRAHMTLLGGILRRTRRDIAWLVFLGLSPLAGVLYMVFNRLRRRLKEPT
jgi:hypothetical protein